MVPLSKNQKWILTNELSYDYRRNVYYMSEVDKKTKIETIVETHNISLSPKINFRKDDQHEYSFHFKTDYYNLSSTSKNFATIQALDINIGLNILTNLPAHFQLTTDMSMLARRGYQQKEMNTIDWIWNAQLSKSFLKGKLLAKLQGFDILQQLSNTKYILDSQGHTEIWQNSVPRYAMLSLSWRFNVNSKKRSH